MKLLLATLLTVLFYSVSFADSVVVVKKDEPKVVIAPVPGGLKVIPAPKKAVYCEKRVQGKEKVCLPQKKQACKCAAE